MNGIANDVQTFMVAGDQTTKTFNARQTAFYIGMQLEELAEKLDVLGRSGEGMKDLIQLAVDLDAEGKRFKRGVRDLIVLDLAPTEKAEMVDADFDLAWVSAAATLSMGVDVHAAHAEGAHTNLCKIGPTGKCVKDPETGKIQKPEGWTKPDFLRLIK